jgi:hypothetical protein
VNDATCFAPRRPDTIRGEKFVSTARSGDQRDRHRAAAACADVL